MRSLAPALLVTPLLIAACSEDDGEPDGDSGSGTASGTSGSASTSAGDGDSSEPDTQSGSTASGTATSDTGSDGSGTSGSATSASGSSATVTREPCQEEEASIEPIPPRIMFVLDKSGSMYCEEYHWDHDGNAGTPDITRWESLYTVVESVVNTFESQIWFGAKLYPSATAPVCTEDCNGCTNACVVDPVEVPVAQDNAMTILATIPPPDARVQGLTPMETGLEVAVDYMKTLDSSLSRALILVADGEISEGTLPPPTNCPGESFTDAEALVSDAWQTHEIATYVVGITDVAENQLDALAQAGGKPRMPGPPYHYQAADQTELQQAMDDIINDQLGCTISIDPEPEEPQWFEVWIDGTEISEVTDCATEDGWVWLNAPPYVWIEVCGSACDELKVHGTAETKYFCEPG